MINLIYKRKRKKEMNEIKRSGRCWVSLFVAAMDESRKLWVLLLSLLLLVMLSAAKNPATEFPPSCNRIECPSFHVVDSGEGFEIRRYDSPVWASTAPIPDISLHEATRTGFLRLFDYIQGKNSYNQKIEMTAPVLTQVSPSDGPFCESSFVVSFYVPKLNQADPPPAKGLHVQRWKETYVAVRQFGGFVTDTNVGVEASALDESLFDTKWAAAIGKSRGASGPNVYTVAQYNSPFEFEGRVNEIWFLFDIEDVAQAA